MAQRSALPLLAILLLSACGGSSTPAAAPSATSRSVQPQVSGGFGDDEGGAEGPADSGGGEAPAADGGGAEG